MSKERGCNRLHSWNEVMIHTGMVVCVPPSKVKSNRSREDDHMYWEPSNKRLAKKKKPAMLTWSMYYSVVLFLPGGTLLYI